MGVLYVEWQEYFSVGPSEVGWLGVIGAAMGPLGCLIAGGLTSRFGHQIVVTLGGALFCLLMFISSFTTSLWQLYLVFAVHALAIGISYQPSATVIGFYFQRWLALANGITFSGVGIGLIVVPIVLETLTARFSWKGALRILSGISLLIPSCGLLFKPSAKEKHVLRHHRLQKDTPGEHGSILHFLGIDLLVKNYRFLLATASSAAMGYGYYGSLVFLASKAVYEVGLNKFQGALLVSLIGIGSTISRASHGLLIDCGLVNPIVLYSLSCFINAGTGFLHPFADCFYSLIVLALSFGLSSGLVFAVSIMCIRSVLHENQVSKGFGVLMLGNGLGTLVGVFVMAYLEEATGSYSVSFVVAGFSMVLAGALMGSVSLCKNCCTTEHQQGSVINEEDRRINEITEEDPPSSRPTDYDHISMKGFNGANQDHQHVAV